MCEMCEKPSTSSAGGREGGEGEGREREEVMQLFADVQVAFSEDSERREVCTHEPETSCMHAMLSVAIANIVRLTLTEHS